MLYRILILLVACASAFEIPSVLSRRAFASAAAAAPLGFAAAAFADSDNKFLGVAKAPTDKLSFDTVTSGSSKANLGGGLASIGRGAVIDDAGSAIPLDKPPLGMPSPAQFTSAQAAARVNGVDKTKKSYNAGLERMLNK